MFLISNNVLKFIIGNNNFSLIIYITCWDIKTKFINIIIFKKQTFYLNAKVMKIQVNTNYSLIIHINFYRNFYLITFRVP